MNKKEAILSLTKALEGTMDAAGMKVVVSPKNEGGKERSVIISDKNQDVVTYKGTLGEVALRFDGTSMNVLCAKPDGELTDVSAELFEYGSPNWNQKDIRSAANEASESIAAFFGTGIVYDADLIKGGKKKNGVTVQPKAPEPKAVAAAEAVQRAKKTSENYDAFHLARRFEAIYQDIRGKAEENIAQYGEFLPEEYFKEYATKYALGSIRRDDRQEMKRLFRTCNTFYDEAEKDVQSLITVSILGMGFAAEPVLLDNATPYMSETLGPAVTQIVKYLRKGSAKRKIKEYDEPTSYKPTHKELRKQRRKSAMLGGK